MAGLCHGHLEGQETLHYERELREVSAMGLDAAHLAASLAKSREVERSPSATQRASEVVQEQLAGESAAAFHVRKPDATDQLQRQKIRQDRERRRRELERQAARFDSPEDPDSGEQHSLDVVA